MSYISGKYHLRCTYSPFGRKCASTCLVGRFRRFWLCSRIRPCWLRSCWLHQRGDLFGPASTTSHRMRRLHSHSHLRQIMAVAGASTTSYHTTRGLIRHTTIRYYRIRNNFLPLGNQGYSVFCVCLLSWHLQARDRISNGVKPCSSLMST